MKYPVYSIRDVKVGFMAPRVEQSDQTMIRAFSYELNARDGIMNFAPKDFDLYKIAEFEQESGSLISCTPTLIVNGQSVYGVNYET